MDNVMEARSSHVVLRMKFSQPNPPNYMKGQDRIAYLEERAWVSNDFIDYAGRQGKYEDKQVPLNERLIFPEKGTLLEYVSRQGTFANKQNLGTEKSNGTGVWGKNGELVGEELERVKNVFKKTGGNIWHGLISPTKEIGDALLNSKEKAMEFSKACFEKFLKATHLRYENIEWYAGWHDDSESGIKHIQFAFCEKEKHLNSKGQYSYTQKGTIKKSVLADTLVDMEEYFSGRAKDVYIARDKFFTTFKNLSPKDIKKNLLNDLIELSKTLPKVEGRKGYRRKEYEPFREQIDKLANDMIKNVPELNRNYIDLISKVSEREERFKKTAGQFNNMQPTDKIAQLRLDIKERIGNSIISFANRLNSFDKKTKEFVALKGLKLSLMAQAREEKFLRQKQKVERRAENKRIKRLFSAFYTNVSSNNYLEEFYREMEEFHQQQIENTQGGKG